MWRRDNILGGAVAATAIAVVALTPIILAAALAQTTVDGAQVITTAPVSSQTTISIGTIASQVLEWVASIFTGVVGLFLTRWLIKVGALAGVAVTDAMKDQLQSVIVNGLNHGAAVVEQDIRGKGQVEIKNAIVKQAVQYTQLHGADIIKKLGLDPQSGETIQAIKARIETAIADPMTPTPAVLEKPALPATGLR